MNKELTQKLKKTSQGIRKVAKLADEPETGKPENFISKWGKVFEAVVEIMEIYNVKH